MYDYCPAISGHFQSSKRFPSLHTRLRGDKARAPNPATPLTQNVCHQLLVDTQVSETFFCRMDKNFNCRVFPERCTVYPGGNPYSVVPGYHITLLISLYGRSSCHHHRRGMTLNAQCSRDQRFFFVSSHISILQIVAKQHVQE